MKTFTRNIKSSLPFSQKYLFTHPNVNVFVTCPSECFPRNMGKFDSTAQTYTWGILSKVLLCSAVKNYRITCSSPVVCSFSASVNFREKQSLYDYIHSSILYPIMKSDFLMPVLHLRKQMFAEISHFYL